MSVYRTDYLDQDGTLYEEILALHPADLIVRYPASTYAELGLRIEAAREPGAVGRAHNVPRSPGGDQSSQPAGGDPLIGWRPFANNAFQMPWARSKPSSTGQQNLAIESHDTEIRRADANAQVSAPLEMTSPSRTRRTSCALRCS
jgi:hypothetical protein